MWAPAAEVVAPSASAQPHDGRQHHAPPLGNRIVTGRSFNFDGTDSGLTLPLFSVGSLDMPLAMLTEGWLQE